MKVTKLMLACLVVFALAAGSAQAAQHTLGIGVGAAPDYEGSEDYAAVPLLMLKGNYDSGRSFSLLGTNLRINVLANKTFQFGPVLNYRMERDDVDNNAVDRMDDIDGAFEVGAYALANMNDWLFGVDFLADVSDTHDGMLVQGSLGYHWKASDVLVVTPTVFMTYADDDYMDTYFGVNSGNRGSSQLPDYEADAGLKDAGIKVVASYTPWERWGITGIVSYASLLNDAQDSPIVDDEGDDAQMFLGVMGTYRFGGR